MAYNIQFLLGCFQYFVARKVRSVVFRLIKTDVNLCRTLLVRLLDIRTPYRMFFVTHFLFFLFVCDIHLILLSF